MLSLVSVKINLAPSLLTSDYGGEWRSEDKGRCEELKWRGRAGSVRLIELMAKLTFIESQMVRRGSVSYKATAF